MLVIDGGEGLGQSVSSGVANRVIILRVCAILDEGVVKSSVWHHQQEDIGDPVKAVNPSRKEQGR